MDVLEAPDTLLERAAELAVLESALDRATSSGGVLGIEGPAGIGKSTLLVALADRARRRGWRVLSARGRDVERDYAFGVARQLLEPALGGPLPEATPREADAAFAIRHRLYWQLAALTADGPVLVTVDDAQWADRASARWLHFVAGRLEAVSLLVALARRPAEPDVDVRAIEGTLADATLVTLEPLSRDAVGELAGSTLGRAPAPEFVAACHRATGGNPFLVRELLRDLSAADIDSPSVRPGDLPGPVPSAVARSVKRRLRELGREATALAESVAVLGHASQLQHAAALAELPLADAAVAADRLVAAELLAAADPAEFAHPLVASAVYACGPQARRAALHARAAEVLHSVRAPVDAVAAHLLRAVPASRPEVVETLRAAAALALRRGAPEVAVTHLRRALAEPPSDEVRPAVVAELGRAEFSAADPRAPERLREALAIAPEADRARVGGELGRALMAFSRLPEARDVLVEAIERARDTDPEAALTMEAELIAASHMDSSDSEIAADRLAGIGRPPPGHTRGERMLLGVLAYEALRSNAPASEVAALVAGALGSPAEDADAIAASPPFWAATLAAIFSGHPALARAAVDHAACDATRRGSPVEFATVACLRAFIAESRGALGDQRTEAMAASELSSSSPLGLQVGAGLTAAAAVESGDLSFARAQLAIVGCLDAAPDEMVMAYHAYVRGVLRFAEGDARGAADDLEASGAALARGGDVTCALFPWRSRAALALAAAGDHDAALALAREELALTRAQGILRPLGVSLTTVGALTPGAEGIELLTEAVAVLEGSPARLDLARALVELGAALRRARRRSDAREPLARGRELAHGCGAAPLAARAEDELRATGARPRRIAVSGLDALTPAERRVARMAAEGRSNRDIAESLFVTVKTVEDHLTATYRKLNISSRRELPGVDGL